MIPAILYGRVSTDKQDTERQTRMFDEYCTRLGIFPIVEPICDLDTSGSVPFADREGGREVFKAIACHGERPLLFVTTEQDRVGRDTLDIITTIRAIWSAGLTPHFIANGGALERTPDNEFKMELQASFAQLERNRIRQRIKSRMTGKRAAGELCGQLSYGFNAEYHFTDGHVELLTGHALTKTERAAAEAKHGKLLKQILTDNPDEQQWLLAMQHLREVEGWGFHSIAKYLNERRVPTKRGRGELMNLRDRRAADGEKSTFKFTGGKWNCGQVKNVLESVTARNFFSDHAKKSEPEILAA